MTVIQLQSLPEQAGHAEPATSRQRGYAILLSHSTPRLATLIPSLTTQEPYPKLRKWKRLCKTSIVQPLQVNPFQSTNLRF